MLAEPSRARRLKEENWVQLLLSEFAPTNQQAESLSMVPPDYVRELQKAIGIVVDHGGSISIERKSENGPGTFTVEPTATAFSIGIFHCTFDSNFRNWHCGWGPSRK